MSSVNSSLKIPYFNKLPFAIFIGPGVTSGLCGEGFKIELRICTTCKSIRVKVRPGFREKGYGCSVLSFVFLMQSTTNLSTTSLETYVLLLNRQSQFPPRDTVSCQPHPQPTHHPPPLNTGPCQPHPQPTHHPPPTIL